MRQIDKRMDEKSRHTERKGGGRVSVLCVEKEKREGWNWYLKLALVNGFFPSWHC